VQELGILIRSILLGFGATTLQGDTVPLVLETLRGDETLDLGGLGVWSFVSFGLEFTANDELANIVLLAKTEETANLGSTLRTKTLGMNHISDSREFVVALLHDAKSQNGKVHANNATTNTLPLPLASATGTIARVPSSEEEPNTTRRHDTLLHRETLLVIAARDAEDVALELVADAVAGDLLSHAAVHKDAEFAFIFDFVEFLRPIGWVRDVQLHD
jgi:hypothetical protein